MKKCPFCNHANEDDARFCSKCGRNIGWDAMIDRTLERLNRYSTSEEIYSAMKELTNEQSRKILYVNKKIKDNFDQEMSQASLSLLNPIEKDYWFTLNKAAHMLLDVKILSESTLFFLLFISMASYKNLNVAAFQKATNHLFSEWGGKIMAAQPASLEKLWKILVKLHTDFLLVHNIYSR
jgi:hypothetical protein